MEEDLTWVRFFTLVVVVEVDLVVNELNLGVLRNSDEKRGTQTKKESSKFLLI